MPRGRGYRGSRGNSSWNGNSSRGGYSSSRYGSYPAPDSRSPYDKPRYSSTERFRSDDYRSYRSEYGNFGRDRRSPERKRLRADAPSSRHDSYYGSSRHDPPSYDRRSSERHSSLISRREDFRRSSGPPKRGSYRGRLSSRGMRGLRERGRPIRRRLLEGSYSIRKRIVPRISDYSRTLKISRMRSAIIARKRREAGSGNENEKGEEDKEKREDVEGKDNEKTEEGKEKKSEDEEKKRRNKAFIKLRCPHCNLRAMTFSKYEAHFRSRFHLLAMKKVALKQKAILGQMRQAQRNTQNELEKTMDDSSKTNFCPLCRLNYKQSRAVHQLSESHNNMKKFLMPFCKVCNVSFKSPMIYENHCASVEHIKRKQRMENSDASGEEDNLENFTTIDSVGDGDGEVSECEEKKDEESETAVNVGIEKIRKIEAYYCDLCKMYLQRGEESDMPKILTRHCKQRVHMHRYVRLKEAQESENKAELLRKESEKAGAEKADDGDGTGDKKDDDETKDDKLWADVDKDLGDILAEAEGNKSSDEDDDSHVNGERYDRFKLSEKNGDEKMITDEEIADNKLVINDATEAKQ